MELNSLVPMAHVRSVTRSIAFYEKLGFAVGNCADVAAFRSMLEEAGVNTGPIQHPFYAPRGEFRVTDPDGYVLMITHT
jgi:catechol 2,3-dioxygenase-like lactoylglutathione lyase family enzyme